MNAVPETRQTKPKVYSLYLQGRHFTNLKGKLNLEQAVALYQQALLIDPTYAPAWVGLSVTYQEQRKFGLRSGDEAFSLSMAATEKALANDSNSATAWANLAYLKKGQLDWAGAKAALDMASSLEPNNAFVIGTAASLAGNLGQLETSIELFERDVKLDPFGLSGLRALAIRYSDAGRFDEAIATFNRIIAINPDYPNIHFNIGATYLDAGNPEKAMTEINKNPSAPNYEFLKVTILSKLGREADAQALIDKLLKTSADEKPIPMAITFAALGENDLAFEWYEKAFQQNPGSFAYFLRRPWNKGLESDPRYPAFVEKLGLLEAWKSIPKHEQVKKP
jgi:tetratricopeptide (TPR) repeat protein